MTALRIDHIEDGGWLVRGTPDLTEDEARRALFDRYVGVGDEEGTRWDEADAAAAVARWQVRIGLYRKTPCVCGGGHAFDMHEASERGSGVFTAAYLT
jgi:hypothetical protein